MDAIWHIHKSEQWKEFSVDNFIHNNKTGELKREEWLPVIKDIITVFPGMKWDSKENRLIDPSYIPNLKKCDWDSFVDTSKDIFLRNKGKRIGVQLSGGLDSSIIICLLNYLNIPFYAIGMSTQRFEFRTERHIQEALKSLAVETILIDYEKHLPMSNLFSIPPHQYPDINSLNYSAELVMAEEAKKLGIEIIYTGDGGDNLLAEPISVNPLDCGWKPQNFTSSWISENVYKRKGIEIVSFYSFPEIMDLIFNFRKGLNEDCLKLWARAFFKSILPAELSNYHYRADFWGIYISGLNEATNEIKKLNKQAFELTNFYHFSEQYQKKLIEKDLLKTNKELYQEIESILALAVWLNGVKNNKLIY